MTKDEPARTSSATRARVGLALTATLLAVIDLALTTWAGRALADGASIDLRLIQLRLTLNPGMAFSLGDMLPSGVILGVTALIVAALAVFAWRAVRTATTSTRLALATVLAGAVANLVDRAPDGVVTDYLHTGWFPTFNLADVFITVGGAAAIITSVGSTESRAKQVAQ